jgi:hypothetical protein
MQRGSQHRTREFVELAGKLRQEALVLYMQIAVSMSLLSVGLLVIVPKQYADADTKWAYGIVGTFIGFWLKGK